MIRLAITSLLLAATSLVATSQHQSENQINDYFRSVVNGNHATAPQLSKKLKLSQIDDARKNVWALWKDANLNAPEEKLPDVLPPLDGKNPQKWNLPESLEPNAVMNYFWGGKSESETPRPLFIYLHGSGPREMEWATGLVLAGKFNDGASAYFIPQIPNAGQWYRWWQKSKQWAWEKMIRQAMLRDDIDPDRIYMFGISEGGYGSQRLASFYADYLAAVGPMAGGEPLINAPAENLRNTPMTFHTGERDATFCRNKLTLRTGEVLDSLQADDPDGYDHLVELVPGKGHGFDYSMTTPWLATKTRVTSPRKVRWENFEMDGRYRDGFYNIFVDSRSNPDENSRTYYTMDIDGNNVNINVSLVTYIVAVADNTFGFPIGLKYDKTYTPATSGKFTVYLDENLVDISKKVSVTVNGKRIFNGKLTPSLDNIAASCARFYDPRRLYPCAITVDLSTLK